MYSYLSNSNILCRKNLINFLKHIFPKINNIDLRSEQFLNIKILKIIKEIVEIACIAVKHRNGKILQEKDIRLVFFQKKKDIFPKTNFLNLNSSIKLRKKLKKKNFKTKKRTIA